VSCKATVVACFRYYSGICSDQLPGKIHMLY